MKRFTVVATVLFAMILTAGLVYAADEAAKPETITGLVAAAKDADGVVTAVTVKVGDVVYNVTFDDKAKELAKLDGKTVDVTGTIVTDDKGVKTITVTEFKEVVKKEEAPK